MIGSFNHSNLNDDDITDLRKILFGIGNIELSGNKMVPKTMDKFREADLYNKLANMR